jgi:hypothetical protein
MIASMIGRGVKYWPVGFGVLGVALQQALVGIALDVGAEGHPLLLVEQVGDQAFELGGILDLVLGLAEHQPQQAVLLAQVLKHAAVLGFQFHAVLAHEGAPVVALGHGRGLVPGRQGLLMGELEEQQHAELLQVVAVREAVVAQHGAVAPELLDDAVGFGAHGVGGVRDAV